MGLITRDAFRNAIEELVPATQSRAAFTPLCNQLFFFTDRVGSDTVDFAELVAAFSLLCDGTKSDKLSLAFRLFDTNVDGRLTRRQLWRFLRSFLTALFCLSSAAADEPVESLYTVIDDATVTTAQLIFAKASETRSTSRQGVTFEEFGNWYNDGGFELLPWLELLDLNKWPTSAAEMSAATANDAAAEAAAEADAANANTALEFPLAEEQGFTLRLGAMDVEAYNHLLSNSQLYMVEPDTLARALLQREAGGLIARNDFLDVARAISPAAPLADEVEHALCVVFDAFDVTGR